MKTCSTCKESKSEEHFSWKVKDKVRSSICKECHKEYRKAHYLANRQKYIDKARSWEAGQGGTLALRYKLTSEQLDALFAKHDGNCWICQSRPATDVDHDHACCPGQYSCGKCVRGVLCRSCNRAIGMLQDNPEVLDRALHYVLESKNK